MCAIEGCFLRLWSSRLKPCAFNCPVLSRRGKFSVVKRCVRKDSGELFAAKFLRTTKKGSSREAILNEISIMEEMMSCVWVLRLYEVFESGREFVLIEEL